jgi:hypothetical protein
MILKMSCKQRTESCLELELLTVAALRVYVRVFMKFRVVLRLGVTYLNIGAPDWFRLL